MKVVILAGGLGTRLSEETTVKPKPMVEIGGMPILWHIMKIYSHYGFNEFIICLGYRGYVIKEFFTNYFMHKSDITIDMSTNSMEVHDTTVEPWKITLVDTGVKTMTGGRIKRVKEYIGNEPFMFTYGDGLSNVNIKKLLEQHQAIKKICTLTAIQPVGRFGVIEFSEGNEISSFVEKPRGDGAWINGGFFVCQPEVFDYISDDMTIWEKEPMETIAKEGGMMAYRHDGFWKPMDTLRDKQELEQLWEEGNAEWKLW